MLGFWLTYQAKDEGHNDHEDDAGEHTNDNDPHRDTACRWNDGLHAESHGSLKMGEIMGDRRERTERWKSRRGQRKAKGGGRETDTRRTKKRKCELENFGKSDLASQILSKVKASNTD